MTTLHAPALGARLTARRRATQRTPTLRVRAAAEGNDSASKQLSYSEALQVRSGFAQRVACLRRLACLGSHSARDLLATASQSLAPPSRRRLAAFIWLVLTGLAFALSHSPTTAAQPA